MSVFFEGLRIAKKYDRNELVRKWGYESRQAISRGVVTPQHEKIIILFVTKKKQSSLPQYVDYIDGDYLFWEGESRHGNDQRIIKAEENNDIIHLFYREIHHSPFVYKGIIVLVKSEIKYQKPSNFVFKLIGYDEISTDIDQAYEELQTLTETEKDAVIRARIGQGDFRRQLIRYWKGCAVTGITNTSFLKASHIKPWRESNNKERLDVYNGLLLTPNLDLLFDLGHVSFKNNGEMILSKLLSNEDKLFMGINKKLALKKINPRHLKYLKYHRENIFT